MKGHTVLEILVAVSILFVLSAGIFSVLIVGDSMSRTDMKLLELQEEARRVMDGMSREIRHAKNSDISIADDGTSIGFVIPTDITTEETTYSDAIYFYLNDQGQVIREHPLDEEMVVANNIESLEFCCCDGSVCSYSCSAADSLQIKIQAKNSLGQKEFVFDMEEKISMRN